MELKDFIARTLTEIAEGVRAAQEATKDLDARINPFRGVTNRRSRTIIKVDFDVAISESEGSATDGRIGVLAGIVGAASSGKSNRDMNAATKIQFSVPMILPSESDISKHSPKKQ